MSYELYLKDLKIVGKNSQNIIPLSQSVRGREMGFGEVGVRHFPINESLENPILLSGILPIAKSTFRVFDWVLPDDGDNGWFLPGHGSKYDGCGGVWRKGCLNVDLHIQSRLDGIDVSGKAYVRVGRQSCNRAECPICYEGWAGKEAHKIEYRLSQFHLKKLKPIHFIVSPPESLYHISLEKLRIMAYNVAKKVNFLGGSCIVHPFREACLLCGSLKDNKEKRCVNCGSFQFGWYKSPHFHMIGYGWIKGVADNYEDNGWIAVNLGVRDSVFATAQYQLSHAGVHDRHHTVTWFGLLSYNKLRVRKEIIERPVCPLCECELFDLRWVGEGDPPVSDDKGDYFVDSKGWVVDRSLKNRRTL